MVWKTTLGFSLWSKVLFVLWGGGVWLCGGSVYINKTCWSLVVYGHGCCVFRPGPSVFLEGWSQPLWINMTNPIQAGTEITHSQEASSSTSIVVSATAAKAPTQVPSSCFKVLRSLRILVFRIRGSEAFISIWHLEGLFLNEFKHIGGVSGVAKFPKTV